MIGCHKKKNYSILFPSWLFFILTWNLTFFIQSLRIKKTTDGSSLKKQFHLISKFTLTKSKRDKNVIYLLYYSKCVVTFTGNWSPVLLL